LAKLFFIDPTDQGAWTSTADIVDKLQNTGYRASSSRTVSMHVAEALKKMNIKKVRQQVGGQRVMGYVGIRAKSTTPIP